MLTSWYTIISALLGIVLAQVVKPFIYYFFNNEWNWRLVFSSEGFPSSHTSGVAACALAVGLTENFSSNLFAVTLVFSLIIAYDAMNVRYYAGQNIQITKQLINDIKELMQLRLDDPIYSTKMKNVLGHRKSEVIGGAFLGLLVASVLYLIIR
ncbi:MAG: divergent PAP2 family protein [Erysipelotrichales bacterium]|nr:divergent PAP2 family protein [Erysipelotrichales bacterium]